MLGKVVLGKIEGILSLSNRNFIFIERLEAVRMSSVLPAFMFSPGCPTSVIT